MSLESVLAWFSSRSLFPCKHAKVFPYLVAICVHNAEGTTQSGQDGCLPSWLTGSNNTVAGTDLARTEGGRERTGTGLTECALYLNAVELISLRSRAGRERERGRVEDWEGGKGNSSRAS